MVMDMVMVYVYARNCRVGDAKPAYYDIWYWLQIIKSVLCLRYCYACVVSKIVVHQTADTDSVELHDKRQNRILQIVLSVTKSMELIFITTFLLLDKHSLFSSLTNAHDQTNASLISHINVSHIWKHALVGNGLAELAWDGFRFDVLSRRTRRRSRRRRLLWRHVRLRGWKSGGIASDPHGRSWPMHSADLITGCVDNLSTPRTVSGLSSAVNSPRRRYVAIMYILSF